MSHLPDQNGITAHDLGIPYPYPVLSIAFVTPSSIDKIGDLLDNLSLEELQKIAEGYSAIRIKDDRDYHVCMIHDLLKDDILNPTVHLNVRKYYEHLIQKHKREKVDMLIVEEVDVIKEKVKKIIDFTMDKIYQTDVILLEFDPCWSEWSSMPTWLYRWAQEFYQVIDHRLGNTPATILIKKRHVPNV